MRTVSKFAVLAGLVGLASVSGFVRSGLAADQAEPATARSARGGLIAKSGQHRFEVFFFPTGVRVYPQGPAGESVDVSRMAATATFYHPNTPRPWFSRPISAETAAAGRAPTSLEHAVGLTNVPSRGVKVTFEVTGLSGPAGSTAEFTVPFELAPTPTPTLTPTPTAAATAALPAAAVTAGFAVYGTAARFPAVGHEVGPTIHRDWATGRGVRLAKPWMEEAH
jgi:hypothetical protein